MRARAGVRARARAGAWARVSCAARVGLFRVLVAAVREAVRRADILSFAVCNAVGRGTRRRRRWGRRGWCGRHRRRHRRQTGRRRRVDHRWRCRRWEGGEAASNGAGDTAAAHLRGDEVVVVVFATVRRVLHVPTASRSIRSNGGGVASLTVGAHTRGWRRRRRRAGLVWRRSRWTSRRRDTWLGLGVGLGVGLGLGLGVGVGVGVGLGPSPLWC